jgi:hypothetical protein
VVVDGKRPLRFPFFEFVWLLLAFRVVPSENEAANGENKLQPGVFGETGLLDLLNGKDRGNTQGENRDWCFLRIARRLGGTGDKAAKGGHQYETDEFFIIDNGQLIGHRTFNLGNARRVGGYARSMETNREYGDEPAV